MHLVRPGAITEITGELSSGRTSLLITGLRDVTRSGAVAALVDADGVFDPAGATRAGVDLRRLLWVRCGHRRDVAVRATDLLVRCPGFALVVLDVGETPPRLSLAAAYRWRLAARRSGAALVVLGARRITGAGAEVSVRARRGRLGWAGPRNAPTRLAGMATCVSVERGRSSDSRPEERWWTA